MLLVKFCIQGSTSGQHLLTSIGTCLPLAFRIQEPTSEQQVLSSVGTRLRLVSIGTRLSLGFRF